MFGVDDPRSERMPSLSPLSSLDAPHNLSEGKKRRKTVTLRLRFYTTTSLLVYVRIVVTVIFVMTEED